MSRRRASRGASPPTRPCAPSDTPMRALRRAHARPPTRPCAPSDAPVRALRRPCAPSVSPAPCSDVPARLEALTDLSHQKPASAERRPNAVPCHERSQGCRAPQRQAQQSWAHRPTGTATIPHRVSTALLWQGGYAHSTRPAQALHRRRNLCLEDTHTGTRSSHMPFGEPCEEAKVWGAKWKRVAFASRR